MSMLRTLATPIAIALPLALATTAAVLAAEPAATAKTTAAAPTEAEPSLAKVASDDALELDVLAVVSLPIAADEAREAGLAADDVAGVITAVVDVGASPAVATDLLIAEAEQVRKRGAKPHFAGWVRGELASGEQAQKLVESIEKAEAEYIEQSAAARAELDAKITKIHDEAVEQRKAQWVKVGQLVKEGKKLRVASQARVVDLRKRVMASAARQKRLAEQMAADPAKRAALERFLAKVEKVIDKAQDQVEKAQDKAADAVDKADKAIDNATGDKKTKEPAQ